MSKLESFLHIHRIRSPESSLRFIFICLFAKNVYPHFHWEMCSYICNFSHKRKLSAVIAKWIQTPDVFVDLVDLFDPLTCIIGHKKRMLVIKNLFIKTNATNWTDKVHDWGLWRNVKKNYLASVWVESFFYCESWQNIRMVWFWIYSYLLVW